MQVAHTNVKTEKEDVTPWQTRIQIAAFSPCVDTDWPGRQVATVFIRGCPWRCAYCHNPALQRRGRAAGLPWAEVEAALKANRDVLQGVVFSGGEPTAERCLPEAIEAVRALGMPVGLHTNGAYPARLAALLPQLDWVGFDLKTDYAGYDRLTGAPGSGARVTESARLLIARGMDCEFRLTWHQAMLDVEGVRLAGYFAHHLGVRRFVLQTFHPAGVAPGTAGSAPPPAALVAELASLFDDFRVRESICGLAPDAV